MAACRAALAIVTCCRASVPDITVTDLLDGASLPWTVVALGHLAAGLLAEMPDDEAEAWLQHKALRVATDLAERDRESPDAPR
jgi:hypothetical protein